jgi:hypothetical protein
LRTIGNNKIPLTPAPFFTILDTRMNLTNVKKKTYADYIKLEEGAPYQLINGMFVKSPSPVPYHQTISKRIQIDGLRIDWKLPSMMKSNLMTLLLKDMRSG